MQPPALPTQAPPTAAIRATGLVRRYGDFTALRGLSLEVPRGALCGLIGQNGAGKTTLLSILATLDEEFEGAVFIDDIDVTRQPAEARRRIGFVPDHAAIYDALTVQQFLAFFAAAAGLHKAHRDKAIDDVIALCGLEELRDRPAGGLSKGLTQRLCVARALLHRPRVLLLDEPASGLDPRARIELKQLLKRLAKDGVTVLISSHILTELGDFCDHVIILDHGQVQAAGPIDRLFADENASVGVDSHRRVLIEIIGDPATACAIAASVPSVYQVQNEGQLLALTMAKDAVATASVVRALVEAGVDVAAVTPERQNLEALFLSITGKGAS